MILKDVLEHVPDFAWWRQQAMVRDLQLGALVVPKDLNPWEHLSRFSPRSLHAALASTGWRRLPQATVDYSFRGAHSSDLLMALPRFARETWRILRGTYYNSVRTSGLFVLTP